MLLQERQSGQSKECTLQISKSRSCSQALSRAGYLQLMFSTVSCVLCVRRRQDNGKHGRTPFACEQEWHATLKGRLPAPWAAQLASCLIQQAGLPQAGVRQVYCTTKRLAMLNIGFACDGRTFRCCSEDKRRINCCWSRNRRCLGR